MTENYSGNVDELPRALKAAKAKSLRFRKQIFRELEAAQNVKGDQPVQQVLSAIRQYSAALVEVTSLEAEIEEHSSAICGVVRGDAVDLDNARREVLDRIARFRERRGG